MKLFRKMKQDMREVRESIHRFNFFQKIWMIILVYMTVNTIMKAIDHLWKKVIEFLEKLKMRKEEDYSGQCPDEYEDPFDDDF